MYKLAFFVPESHLEHVKSAAFSAGAGHIGNYDQCCWQVRGVGQFRPSAGSRPFIGALNQLEEVVEFKVEMVCSADRIQAAVAAVRAAHPYEEPAIECWLLAQVAL